MTVCAWCGLSMISRLSISDFILFTLKNEQLCQQCKDKLVSLDAYTTCSGCSKVQSGSELCRDCIKWKELYPDYVNNHQAIYGYDAFAKEIIEQFKFTGDCETACLFKDDIKSFFSNIKKKTIVVPIPLSLTSYSSRGFNQTELLLEAADVNYSSLLENKYQIEKQSKKNRAERLKTPQPFAVKEQYKTVIQGSNIILADDIYTTGRTIFHAVELLKRYEPASIKSFSLFR